MENIEDQMTKKLNSSVFTKEQEMCIRKIIRDELQKVTQEDWPGY